MYFVVATSNKGKLFEIKEIFKATNYEVISMGEAGFNEDIEENGNSFEENALIKARAIAKKYSGIIMADDSGLEVDYLNGEPGIYSARYAGIGAKDTDNVEKLLKNLEGVPESSRSARFICAIAIVLPNGNEFTVRGSCEGVINFEPKGQNGFGYDPIFQVREFNKTMAELELQQKNEISHRGKALLHMRRRLEEMGL